MDGSGRRIVIAGISGTGKSTLARRLSVRQNLPLHHMDSLVWKPNWQEASEEEVSTALAAISETDSWLVEGWIDSYSQPLLERATQILYLDFPGWQAALGGLKRARTYRGTKRPEMPEGCTEDFDLKFLKVMLLRQERPHLERLLASANPATIKRLTSRRAVEKYLAELALADAKSFYGADYPEVAVFQQYRASLEYEGPFLRSYFDAERKMGTMISRFMDGSASITLAQVRRNWWRWSYSKRFEFCQALHWLRDSPEFPDILRFLVTSRASDFLDNIALDLASKLPQEEAFAFLTHALEKSPEHSANLTQAIAYTQHPQAKSVLLAHLDSLWQCPDLWKDNDFSNPIAYDAIRCIKELIELGISPDRFANRVRALSGHVCKGNRESCVGHLKEHYPWLQRETGVALPDVMQHDTINVGR